MDRVSRSTRSRIMRASKPAGNALEESIARELARHGVRFRRNVRGLPGTPDFVVELDGAPLVAAFAHGCFWHGCSTHYRPPRSNVVYWRRKVDDNIARDRAAEAALRAMGVRVVVAWEHECRSTIARRIKDETMRATLSRRSLR
jgi:DNA mismatch endonuclease (patch repair protein)